AVAAYDQALARVDHPEARHWRLYYSRAVALERSGQWPRAEADLRRALELRPNGGYIVDSLGWAYYRLGDFGNATQILEHAIELLPEDPTVNDHLGDAYWQAGPLAEARFQWRRALQFKPEADEIKTIETKLDRGPVKPPSGSSTRGG